MSMSDFHPELWNPTWSVRTILVIRDLVKYASASVLGKLRVGLTALGGVPQVGLVSFMNSEENTTGGLMNVSAAERVKFAKLSLGSCLAASGPSAAVGAKLGEAFPALPALAHARAAAGWPPPRLPPLPPTAGQLKAAAEARAAAEAGRAAAGAKAEAAAENATSGGGGGGSTDGGEAVAVSSTCIEEPAKAPLSKGQKKKEKERRKRGAEIAAAAATGGEGAAGRGAAEE
jgi:hypothetical protein